MNCKNCEYAIKHRSLQDNEWYTRCTYEEGECVKITELEAQIEKMRCCQNCLHYRHFTKDINECAYSFTTAQNCRHNNFEKWEIKEND